MLWVVCEDARCWAGWTVVRYGMGIAGPLTGESARNVAREGAFETL